MDFAGVRSITFEYANLANLSARKTSNPLAEEFIPELLRQAIAAGIPVFVKASESGEIYRLIFEEGKYKFEPIG